jgi:hypothetical protein
MVIFSNCVAQVDTLHQLRSTLLRLEEDTLVEEVAAVVVVDTVHHQFNPSTLLLPLNKATVHPLNKATELPNNPPHNPVTVPPNLPPNPAMVLHPSHHNRATVLHNNHRNKATVLHPSHHNRATVLHPSHRNKATDLLHSSPMAPLREVAAVAEVNMEHPVPRPLVNLTEAQARVAAAEAEVVDSNMALPRRLSPNQVMELPHNSHTDLHHNRATELLREAAVEEEVDTAEVVVEAAAEVNTVPRVLHPPNTDPLRRVAAAAAVSEADPAVATLAAVVEVEADNSTVLQPNPHNKAMAHPAHPALHTAPQVRLAHLMAHPHNKVTELLPEVEVVEVKEDMPKLTDTLSYQQQCYLSSNADQKLFRSLQMFINEPVIYFGETLLPSTLC